MAAKNGNLVSFHGGSARELEALLTNEPSKPTEGKGWLGGFAPTAALGKSPPYAISVLAALLYGSVGLVMGFANKAVLQVWPYSNTFLMLQMATSIAIIYGLHALRIINVRPLELRAARNLVWVVFFYNANVAFALAAVRALSIPVYHVLKRLTPVMVLGVKYFSGEGPPPLQITLSVLTVVAGCILAGLGDLSFDPMGYTMAFASCALQTTYLVMVERSGTEKGYNSNELLLYNAVMSLPVLTVLVYITGEGARSLPSLWAHQSSNFLWLLGGSLVMGSLLNYTLFLCTITNSALSTTIVGTLRSVFGTILGFFVLGGVKATPLIILGVTTNTAGGVWYTAVKFRQKYSSKGSDEGSTQFGSSDPKRSPRPVEHSTFSSSLEPKRSQQDP